MSEPTMKPEFIEVMRITLAVHNQMRELGLEKYKQEAVCRVFGIVSPDGKMPDKTKPLDERDHWHYAKFLHMWKKRQEEEKTAKKE